MIEGYATFKGTRNIIGRNGLSGRRTPYFMAAPIGIGTHLGEMNETDSGLYRQGMEYGLIHGLNFIDTAINYRGMRSERDVGYVLNSLIEEKGLLQRDEVIISTKGGLIPGDVLQNLVPAAYLQQVLLEGNILSESDLNVVGNVKHVMSPRYYQFAIEQSRQHLQLSTIDIYYIHNPEISKMMLPEEIFYGQLEELFAMLENQVKRGNIRHYGLATWRGLIAPPDDKGYISIQEAVKRAKSVAGEDHHFRFLQFPLNSIRNEAVTFNNQKMKNKWMTVVEAAKEAGLYSTTSAPFELGKLTGEGSVKHLLKKIISTEEVLSTMVGMKQVKHIKENLEVLKGINV
ncbi:aldo/keto reductase [Bacillus sp. KH172YL63]|uniref:aldo/keto reductase n=1 Tax=Bacillus sp. KH172YL63 TaxID=2709784 RepID=UPI0013E42F1A|nr:aldo/keto reductase [Bacillus sp. KH172YL63]BCB03670.1 aldo/keto reductase [Bacillus sp. KH172YL63]